MKTLYHGSYIAVSSLKPHVFFDDQIVLLEKLKDIPAVHIPFGVANKKIYQLWQKIFLPFLLR